MILPSVRAFGLLLATTMTASCGDPVDPGSPSSSSSASSSSASSSTSSSSGAAAVLVEGIPTGDPAAMNAWLQRRGYLAWAKESAARPFATDAGGHSGTVRTYLSPILDASMKAGASAHPRGAAAVKELYSGETLKGWAAYVKTEDASDGGRGFYWYEVFGTAPDASSIGGQGSPTCTGCHSLGRDFVRVPYPLN